MCSCRVEAVTAARKPAAAALHEQSLRRLIPDFGWRVLEVDAHPETVTAILRGRTGDDVARASNIAPVVLLDGREFDAATADETRPIVGVLPWLPLFVATLLEHQRGQFSRERAFEAVSAVPRPDGPRAISTDSARPGRDD
jgi:hypothetical protein